MEAFEKNEMQEVYMSQSNPSNDHSQNIDKIREIVRNTEENIREAEFGMEFLDPVQGKMLEEKNKRRKQSVKALKEEMKEEIEAHKKGKE